MNGSLPLSLFRTALGSALLLLSFSHVEADGFLEAKKFDECRRTLLDAKHNDILFGLEWERGKAPKIVIGPRFLTIETEDRKRFADSVNCFLAGGRRRYSIDFELVDWKTGRVVAHYRLGKLHMTDEDLKETVSDKRSLLDFDKRNENYFLGGVATVRRNANASRGHV